MTEVFAPLAEERLFGIGQVWESDQQRAQTTIGSEISSWSLWSRDAFSSAGPGLALRWWAPVAALPLDHPARILGWQLARGVELCNVLRGKPHVARSEVVGELLARSKGQSFLDGDNAWTPPPPPRGAATAISRGNGSCQRPDHASAFWSRAGNARCRVDARPASGCSAPAGAPWQSGRARPLPG